MLAVGRALMSRPKVIMMDEPSLGLAPIIVKGIFEIIKEINKQGVTVLLIEHDMSLVSGICEKLSVLNFGQLLCEGKTAEVLKNPEVITAYLGE
mgnify:CR=1 FL=1